MFRCNRICAASRISNATPAHKWTSPQLCHPNPHKCEHHESTPCILTAWREGMTTSKINPLTLTNAIAINMVRSMAILTGILLFIINPCYCGDGIRDDVHAMNSRCRNPWFSRSDNLLRHPGCFRNNPLSLLYDEMSGHSRPLVPYFLPTSHWHPYSPIPRLCQTYIRILGGRYHFAAQNLIVLTYCQYSVILTMTEMVIDHILFGRNCNFHHNLFFC